jgi:hypothetical protein
VGQRGVRTPYSPRTPEIKTAKIYPENADN